MAIKGTVRKLVGGLSFAIYSGYALYVVLRGGSTTTCAPSRRAGQRTTCARMASGTQLQTSYAPTNPQSQPSGKALELSPIDSYENKDMALWKGSLLNPLDNGSPAVYATE